MVETGEPEDVGTRVRLHCDGTGLGRAQIWRSGTHARKQCEIWAQFQPNPLLLFVRVYLTPELSTVHWSLHDIYRRTRSWASLLVMVHKELSVHLSCTSFIQGRTKRFTVQYHKVQTVDESHELCVFKLVYLYDFLRLTRFGGKFRCKFRCCVATHEKHDTFAPFVATCHGWEAASASFSQPPISTTPCSHLSTTPCPWHIPLSPPGPLRTLPAFGAGHREALADSVRLFARAGLGLSVCC